MSAPDAGALAAAMPLAVTLGIAVTSASPAEVHGRMPWKPELCTTGGILHGGAIMSLADTLGAICAFLNLPPGAATTTIESKTNFFAAVRGEHADAVCKPLHVGRRTIVVQTDVFDAKGKRAAQITQTQAVI